MMNYEKVSVLPPARCHGLRADVPADDCQALRQALFVGDAPAEVLHWARGREHARHQHRRRGHRLPHYRRAHLVPTALRGAPALHRALETEPFRGGV